MGLPLPPPRVRAQVKRFQLTFLLFNFPMLGLGDLEEDLRDAQGDLEGKQKAKMNIGFSAFGSLVFCSVWDKVYIENVRASK